MAAPQDEWARPLAKTLVDSFRVPSLSYIRVATSYNTTTGLTSESETTYTGAGAIIKTANNEETGELGGNELIEVWIDLQGIGDTWPTTNDYISYDSKKWRVQSIDPQYSGDVKYACKVKAYAA
tara:strand:- start:2082 stop:2453 length:372 start_codon:yes stop_codon:yes gene_type:complete